MQFRNICSERMRVICTTFDGKKWCKNSSRLCLSDKYDSVGGDLKARHQRLRRFLFKVAAELESGRYRRLETTPAPPTPLRHSSLSLSLSRVPVPQHCNWRTREPVNTGGVAKKGKRAGSRSRRGWWRTRSFRMDGCSVFIKGVAGDLANTPT